MKKVLVICPTERDYRELSIVNNEGKCDFIFNSYSGQEFDYVVVSNGKKSSYRLPNIMVLAEGIAEKYKNRCFGVFSTRDYPGVVLSSIVARLLDLPGPRVETILECQHKYYARLAQKKICSRSCS